MKIDWIPRHMAPSRQHLINLEHEVAIWKNSAETACRNTQALQEELERTNERIERIVRENQRERQAADNQLAREEEAHALTERDAERLEHWRVCLCLLLLVLSIAFASLAVLYSKRGDMIKLCSPSGETTVEGVR